MSKIYEAFLPYRDEYGLNQDTSENGKGKPSQNGALFTMEYLIVLLEDPNTSDELKTSEIERIKKVFATLESPNAPGLSRRSPNSLEPESMDNCTAYLAFMSLFTDGAFAKRMKCHGKKIACEGIDLSDKGAIEKNKKAYIAARILNFGFPPKNYWNNTEPKLFCVRGWFGRSPGFMCLLDWAARDATNPLRWLGLLIGQFWGSFQHAGDQDGRKLPYVVWYYLKRRSWFWKLAYNYWCKRLMKTYKNGIRDVYHVYYVDKNHPLSVYSPPFHKN